MNGGDIFPPNALGSNPFDLSSQEFESSKREPSLSEALISWFAIRRHDLRLNATQLNFA